MGVNKYSQELSYMHPIYTYIIYSNVNIRNNFVSVVKYHMIGFLNIEGKLVSTEPMSSKRQVHKQFHAS